MSGGGREVERKCMYFVSFFHIRTWTYAANEDYVPLSIEKVITPGDLSAEDTATICTTLVTTVDDIIVEGFESFIVTVTPITHRIESEVSMTITIKDNDGMLYR